MKNLFLSICLFSGLNSFAGDIPRDQVKCVKTDTEELLVEKDTSSPSHGGMEMEASLNTFECKNITQRSTFNFYNIVLSFFNNKDNLTEDFPVAIASLTDSNVVVTTTKAFKNIHTNFISQARVRIEDISQFEKLVVDAVDESSISSGRFTVEMLD